MPRQSKHDHVRKICRCSKWKECTHPWFVDYHEGREIGPNGKVRKRGLRKRLSTLVGREPKDFADAKVEAQRAILAWKDGRDAKDLLPGDAPTLAAVLAEYRQRPGASPAEKYQVNPIVTTIVHGKPFGEYRAAAITRDMIEAFRQQRRRYASNRNLAYLRAMFNWAVLRELLPATPFKVGNVSAIRLAREEPRTRRLEPGEEERLRAAASGLLHDLIVAALETGCRRGELLSLQWSQVRGDLFFPAGKTKAKKARRVPISSVLRQLLDARQHDPAGDPLPPTAYVFGDEVGRRRRSGLVLAWENAVLKAHGHKPVRVKNGPLSPTSREAFRTIGLHFHDLRREAGSRWMDAGVPLSVIQKWLGHANISQTSTYLAASGGGDADAMRAFEIAAGRLPQIAPFSGSELPNTTTPTPTLSEIPNKNPTVH